MRTKVHWVGLLYVGGNANSGSLCGLSASYANAGFSLSWEDMGARLKFIFTTITSTTTSTDTRSKAPMKTAQLGGVSVHGHAEE